MTGPQAGRQRGRRGRGSARFGQDKGFLTLKRRTRRGKTRTEMAISFFVKRLLLLFPPLHAPSNGFVFIPRLSLLSALLLLIPPSVFAPPPLPLAPADQAGVAYYLNPAAALPEGPALRPSPYNHNLGPGLSIALRTRR